METPLLQTKLYIPPPRPDLVSRPRLIERLNEGLHRKLTLISAPAGFGKTTLVSSWIDHLAGVQRSRASPELVEGGAEEKHTSPASSHPHTPAPVAWLSLDEGDNDPVRFLAYFVAALQTIEANIGKGALSALQSPQPPPTEIVLTSLLNEIAALPDRLVLVLDDYHLIETQPIHDTLTFLLEHLPPQMHLVIATREDPHLPLARLRARGQLTELRATDLRFTSSEAAEFLNQVMGLDLSAEDIAALETRTEGWIAGLQLAAISMQGHKDATSFIKSFTGSHHFILDYLIEEVLERQSESIQTFLLQTAVLDRLCGSLCDALTDQDNGQATLETLEHANLFIVPLDEERRWYRYHHLFSELLRQRLCQKQPDWVPTLHRRASEWYEQNGYALEAIEHALRAENFERAAHLITDHADTLWQRGQYSKLQRLQTRLPGELVLSKPYLCILQAWYLAGSQQDAAEQSLQAAEKVLDTNTKAATEHASIECGQLTDSEKEKLQGRIAAIRAFLASYRGDVQSIETFSCQALDYLPKQDLIWRNTATVALGEAYALKGDMPAAYRVRLEALQASQAASNIYMILIASLKLAFTVRHQGWLQRTIEICRQQIQLATESGLSQAAAVGCSMAMWGETLAELNDLNGAIQQGRKGVELAEPGGDLVSLGWSYLCLIRILFSRGDLAGGQEIVKKIESLNREFDVPPWITNQMAAWKVRIWLAQHKLETASQWIQDRGLNANGDLTYLDEMAYIALARILMAQGRLDETTELLQRLLEPAKAGGRTTRVIEMLILQVLVFQAGGDIDRAMITLEQALTLAEPGGFTRIFVDEGPPMARLLYEAVARGIAPDYARRLLTAFPVTEPQQTDPLKTQAPESDLIEPLSERELEVLQLIAEGLTNPEIAARLFLTLNTVKVHTRNIYGKLDAHNRTQAVARARALGILPSI